MKKSMTFTLACALGLVGQAAHASPELAKAKNCMACHAAATKLVGPSFKDIAGKYGADAGAEGKLLTKVQKGSSGVWGPVPMPANPQLSEAYARTLVKWILSQK